MVSAWLKQQRKEELKVTQQQKVSKAVYTYVCISYEV
jgi:hypothetical protein